MAMLGAECSPCCDKKCDFNSSLSLTTQCTNRADFSYGPVFDGVPQFQEILASRQTITVPEHLSLPVTVKFCGIADDGFAINGTRIAFFAQNPADRTITTRTFTVGLWNDGGPAVGSLIMCFSEQNPLP